jgi:hypothetical protein
MLFLFKINDSLYIRIKMKNQTYGTSEAVPESKREIVERQENSIPLT